MDKNNLPSFKTQYTDNLYSEEILREVEIIDEGSRIDTGIPEQPSKSKKGLRNRLTSIAIIMAIMAGTFGFGLGLATGISQYLDWGNPDYNEVTSNPFVRPVNILSAIHGNTVSEVFKEVSSAVVSINVKNSAVSIFNQRIDQASAGSGVIFMSDSENIYIVTNYHVIANAKEATISLDDTKQVPARYVGGNESNDIAIISVSITDLNKAGIDDYTIAVFGDSDLVEVGDAAIAIGNALGEGKSATLGIISALNKKISEKNKVLDVLQTDAAINPGNSGGALVNAKGEVIGINTMKVVNSQVEGIGYAIPSNNVQSIIKEILGRDQVNTPFMGIEGVDITEELKVTHNLPALGVYVNGVTVNSGAEEGGIRQGDIITAINGKTITSMSEIIDIINNSAVGDTLSVTVLRRDRKGSISSLELKVTLKSREQKF